MASVLLMLLLFQAGPQGSGTVTGIVRSATVVPTANVRVFAQQVRDRTDADSPDRSERRRSETAVTVGDGATGRTNGDGRDTESSVSAL